MGFHSSGRWLAVEFYVCSLINLDTIIKHQFTLFLKKKGEGIWMNFQDI